MSNELESLSTGAETESTVAHVTAESIEAANSWDVRAELLRVLYAHGPVITVDLSGVTFMDSSGLGMLIGVLREARDMGGNLIIRNPSREVRRILDVTGLLGVLCEA